MTLIGETGGAPTGDVNKAEIIKDGTDASFMADVVEASKTTPVIVDFWATWCGPCRKEMPLLEQIHRKYAPLGLVMVGINVEEDGRLFDTFLKDVPVSFPILLDPKNGVSKLYDVAAMPSTVIIDRKGNIRYVHQGYQPGDENAYQDMVRTLIRERT